HELVGREARGELGEADDVAEEHRRLREAIRDDAGIVLEALRDAAREDVEEEAVAACALRVERGHLLADHAPRDERDARLDLDLVRGERADRTEREDREVQRYPDVDRRV